MPFRAASSNEAISPSTTITKPTGTVDGDLVVLVAITDANPGTVTWPSGFVETSVTPLRITVHDVSSLYVATKIASGEPSSWTVTTSTNSKRMALSFSGIDGTTPIHRISGRTISTGAGSPWAAASVAFSGGNTTLTSDLVLIVDEDTDSNGPVTHTPPAGFTTAVEFTGVDIYQGAVYTKDSAGSGETGIYSATGTQTGATCDRLIVALALANFVVAPPPTFLSGDDDAFIPQVELPGYPRISYS